MQRSPARGEAPMHVYVIHENAAWLEPLARALDAEKVPWRDWFLDQGMFDLSQPPPQGVFYNRMSASSHTRDHRYAAELTASVLAWLEQHKRRVVNGSRALDLEISKARQYAALEKAGIRTPDTILVAGKELLTEAARQRFGGGPFILKPNRGGKGLGVRLFNTLDALGDYLDSPGYDPPADGFDLCPADVCAVGEPRTKFTVIDDIDPVLKHRYEAFLAANDIGVAGIELITDADGAVYTYDVNTNTNY